jgi:hypothetical protein
LRSRSATSGGALAFSRAPVRTGGSGEALNREEVPERVVTLAEADKMSLDAA